MPMAFFIRSDGRHTCDACSARDTQVLRQFLFGGINPIWGSNLDVLRYAGSVPRCGHCQERRRLYTNARGACACRAQAIMQIGERMRREIIVHSRDTPWLVATMRVPALGKTHAVFMSHPGITRKSLRLQLFPSSGGYRFSYLTIKSKQGHPSGDQIPYSHVRVILFHDG